MSTHPKVVHLPKQHKVKEAKISSRMLCKYADADKVQMSLKASNGLSDSLVLPGYILQLLLDIMPEMARDNAITLIPILDACVLYPKPLRDTL